MPEDAVSHFSRLLSKAKGAQEEFILIQKGDLRWALECLRHSQTRNNYLETRLRAEGRPARGFIPRHAWEIY